MKKLSLLIFVLFLCSGCSSIQKYFQKQDDTLTQMNHVLEVKTKFPDAIDIQIEQEADEDYGDVNDEILTKYLQNFVSIEEIENPPDFILPTYLYKDQFYKFYKLGDIYFLLFSRQNMNFKIDQATQNAGILVGKPINNKWELFFEIKDNDIARNNPFYFWNELDVLFLLVVDDYGAGSGEGVAKLIKSKDGGLNWDMVKCFYYTPEEFEKLLPETAEKIGKTIKSYLEMNLNSDANVEYIYNPEFDAFVYKPNLKIKPDQDTYIEENCSNIILKQREYEQY